ncbi:MAG: UbiX family flavin prenyltransferase [Candidatus Omnitrophica bacterium]|nr:UbiX family flavin prenyltransferase [Candidatus Omnitrophota bacterium]
MNISGKPRIVVAVTGASGAIYGFRLAELLVQKNFPIYLVVTQAARLVAKHELGLDFGGGGSGQVHETLVHYFKSGARHIQWLEPMDLLAPISSGSHKTRGMIVAPCSMGALSGIAHGLSRDLVERAADVTLKEKRPLILIPRESPLSPIHLENMLSLSRIGVHIVPAAPAFYQRPKRIQELVDFIVGRALDLLGIEHDLFKRWHK